MKIVKLLSISLLISQSASAQTEIYNEDFQNGMPGVMMIRDNDGLTPDVSVSEYTDAWIVVSDPDNVTDSVAGSTSFFSPVGSADRWLITPDIGLSTYGNVLYWEAKSHDASYPDSYHVLVSTTDTEISSFTDTIEMINQETAADWASRSVNLSDEGYNSVNVHIAFVNKSSNAFKLYIDDIRVEIEDPLAVSKLEANEVKVYPNPTADYINIQATNLESIEILSLSGSLLISSKENKVDLRSLSEGHYIIKTTANGVVSYSKVAKL